MKTIIFKKKSIMLVTILTIVSAVFFVGCGGTSGNEEVQNDETVLKGTISMAGSTSVQPLSEELAAIFMQQHSNVRLEVAGGGSSAGPKSVVSGAAEIGAASREIYPEELENVDSFVIAIDGIAVIVNAANPINNISFENVQQIFRGEITNWSEIDGADKDIVVVNREEGSGTRGAFHELVVGKDNEFVNTAIIQNSTGAVREAVANDANAVGYISLGGINDSIKPLKVDGVQPVVEEIRAGKYPIARPFNYVVKKGAQLSAAAQAFIDFVLSDEGQKVVKDNGFVPIK